MTETKNIGIDNLCFNVIDELVEKIKTNFTLIDRNNELNLCYPKASGIGNSVDIIYEKLSQRDFATLVKLSLHYDDPRRYGEEVMNNHRMVAELCGHPDREVKKGIDPDAKDFVGVIGLRELRFKAEHQQYGVVLFEAGKYGEWSWPALVVHSKYDKKIAKEIANATSLQFLPPRKTENRKFGINLADIRTRRSDFILNKYGYYHNYCVAMLDIWNMESLMQFLEKESSYTIKEICELHIKIDMLDFLNRPKELDEKIGKTDIHLDPQYMAKFYFPKN